MTPQPAEQPRTALREFVEEASFGPWRRETGVAPSEEEHMVWLTNEAGDSLLVNADDVAMLVNAAIEAAPLDPVATPPEALVERIRTALPRMMKAALPGAFLQADDLALGAEAAGRILDDEARRYLASATEGETAE